VEVATIIVLVLSKELVLGNFLSNFESKDMVSMEGIGKVTKKTTNSKVKDIVLKEGKSTTMEIVEHYVYYSMDLKKINLEAYLGVMIAMVSWIQ